MDKLHRELFTEPILKMDALAKIEPEHFEPFYSTLTQSIDLSIPPVVLFG